MKRRLRRSPQDPCGSGPLRRSLARAAFAVALLAPGGARADEPVKLQPSARGALGAWMVAGPFAATAAEAARPPARGWKLISTGADKQDPGVLGARSVDLRAALDAKGKDLVAWATGRLHVEQAGKFLLLLGVDDGVQVAVDGKVVFTRDEARPLREDDDIVPLDLGAGDHEVTLRLHQRDGAWIFRARFVDSRLEPPPGAYLELPGTTGEDARALAAKMSWLVVDRVFDSRTAPPRYRPSLVVRYPDGAPRGVPLAVSVKIDGVFELDAGGTTGSDDLVVALPPLEPWTGTLTLESAVAGRTVRSSLVARPASERALVRVDQALAKVRGDEPWLRPGSLDSVRFLARRLARFLSRGDSDAEAQAEEATDLDRLAANLERGVDPYEGRTGAMRRALVTPFDAAPSEYGLYVPPSFRAGGARRYPLIVGLHGMNSAPLSMMRALFGQDDEKKDPWWKDRHPVPLPPVEAFVITPYAHGNTMYREIGEEDVLTIMEWAKRTFPIDETRITVTGPSMGGIGSASLPFHFPHLFAAAAPLCGYHSYLIRPELTSRIRRGWERSLLEERSNVLWAENGEHLPLYIVHGRRDLPEANSGVLIERYEKLKYSVKHEHPDLGHNVWGPTYGDLKGVQWLLGQRLDPHPARVRFRTMRSRYATSAWLAVDELANELAWGDVDARVTSRTRVTITTSGVVALTLTRDEKLVDPKAPLAVVIDGETLTFGVDEAVVMHRTRTIWEKGPALHEGPFKRGHVTGPIRDVFHEPITFVYADGDEVHANREVVRAFADRPGVPTHYPVMSDTEFLARNEPLANDRALFLVGRTNKVLQALGGALPIRIEAGKVSIGDQTVAGREVGAAFIHPNPQRPDRYVVVVAGVDLPGMLRARSLPELLPDYVVWDATLAPATGQVMLGGAAVRAAGMFRRDWSLPADPLLAR